MRDLPCAGDGNSRISAPILTRVSNQPGRVQQPESSAAKALLLTSSGARARARERMAKPRPF